MLTKKIFSLSLISVLLISFGISFVLSTNNGFPSKSTIENDQPNQSFLNNPSEKISAEEENIDSFDVNPASGRWETTDSLADDRIIDSNLRLINSNNDSSATSEYIGQRGLTKSDGKYEYRYKTEYDGDNTTEYFRDVLGDSADFEEGDAEGLTKVGSATETTSNGIYTLTSTTTQSNIKIKYYISDDVPSTDIYSNFEFVIFSEISDPGFILQSGSEGINLQGFTSFSSKTWTAFNIDLSLIASYTGNAGFTIRFSHASGSLVSGEFFKLKYVKLIGDYDYATHDENGGIEDTWDWEDSFEYFYDSYDNVSDFDDGTVESWTGRLGGNLENDGSGNLNITDNNGDVAIEATGLSISASGSSGYDYLTFEYFASLEIDIITITDSATNQVCQDTTNRAVNTWHLFTCDLDLDADWTGTESEIDIFFGATSVSSWEILINGIFLYDESLGDLEGWTGLLTSPYVHPEGLFVMRTDSSSEGATMSSMTLDSSVYDLLVVRGKASQNTVWEIQDAGSATKYMDTETFTTSFQTFEILLSDDSDWTGIITDLYFRSATSGSVIEVDYILLLKSENETAQDVFTVGLYDQDASVSLMNVTQHYYSNDEFQWRVYLTDSQNDIVSYYYHDENDSSTLAGYPAVDSDLFVSGFTNTENEWNVSGSSPYLSSIDSSNKIEVLFDNNVSYSQQNRDINWFTFADTSSSHTNSYTTQLKVYAITATGNDRLYWKIDTSGDTSPEFTGSIPNIISGWNTVSLPGITTKTDINSARIYFTYSSDTNSTLGLDAVKLSITRDSTAQEKTCFETYCRVRVSYNVLTSDFDVEVKTDGNKRIFKANYPDDFTNNGSIPALFIHEKAPDIFFSSYTTFLTAQETWIDYIEAPYKENEWRQTTDTITDTNIITSNWNVLETDGGAISNNDAVWRLNVPSLDAVSGNIKMDKHSGTVGANDHFSTSFNVYGVDSDDGELHLLHQIHLNMDGIVSEHNTVTLGNPTSYFSDAREENDDKTIAKFSMTLSEDRTDLSGQIRIFWNDFDNTSVSYVTDKTFNTTIANELDNPSQEFVLETNFTLSTLTGTQEIIFEVFDLAFIERDWFSDPIGFIGGIIGGAADVVGGGLDIVGKILKPLFDFLATIVRMILSGLTAIIIPLFNILQSAMEAAITALGVILDASISGLGTLLDASLTTLGSLLEGAIQALEPFLTALEDVMDSVLTAITEIAVGIIDQVILVMADVLDAILALLETIIDAVIAINSYLLDGLIDLIDTVFPGTASFIRGFNDIDLASTLTDLFDLVILMLQFSMWTIFLLTTAYIFFFSFAEHDFDPGQSVSQMGKNALKPIGFDFNTAIGTIPIRLNIIFIWLLSAILTGSFSWILPFAII